MAASPTEAGSLTPSEMVGRHPQLAAAMDLSRAPSVRPKLPTWMEMPIFGVMFAVLTAIMVWVESEDVSWALGMVTMVVGLVLLQLTKTPSQPTGPHAAVRRLVTALLALEQAGAIALAWRDGQLDAEPAEDFLPRHPAGSLETSLLRGRKEAVRQIVTDWLGDKTNEPINRAERIIAALDEARALRLSGAALPGPGAEAVAALAGMYADANARGLMQPLIAAVTEGLEAARVPIRYRGLPNGGAIPERYKELPAVALTPGHVVVREPDAQASPAEPDDESTGSRSGAPGCLLMLSFAGAVVGLAFFILGVPPRFFDTVVWYVVAGSLLALVSGTLARIRRRAFDARGYLDFEPEPHDGFLGSWCAVDMNGRNRSSWWQDVVAGSIVGVLVGVAFAYDEIWVQLPTAALGLICLSHPWRITGLSPTAKRRIVAANLDQSIEGAADAASDLPGDAVLKAAAPAEPPLEELTPELPPVTHALDLARTLGHGDLLQELRASAPHHLLMLRVFGSGAHGEIVHWMRDWTRVGHMVALEGDDTVADNEQLDRALSQGDVLGFLVDTPEEVEATLADWFSAPQREWRFLTAQCTNATWKQMVALLLARTDMVLMDLTSFSAARQGSKWELQALADQVPLERVALLVNTDTDLAFLGGLLANIRTNLAVDSPNRGRDVTWRLLRVGGPPDRQLDESHWDWLRRADQRLTPRMLCACLAQAVMQARRWAA